MRCWPAVACFALLAHLACPASAAADGPWALTTDHLLYSDTDNVLVLTSQVGVAHELEGEGSRVSARGIVDVVSAASVDVVSHATARFDEVRWEANLGAAYRFGDLLPALHYRISREPDYDSQSFGGGVQARLGGADTVGSLDYTATLDTVGRTDTPAAVFAEALDTHTLELGLTQNLDLRTVLRGVYTATLQRGYMEKPYRFVPIFTREDLLRARGDGVRLGLDTFERYHTGGRPAESVPDERLRHALGLRLLRYVDSIDGSVRVDYRFYLDDWLLQGHTVEGALYQPVASGLMLETFARAHFQTGASFWKRVYVVEELETLPRYRTLDRKLSPYWSVTAGARGELTLGPVEAYLELSAMTTHLMDYLLLDERLALMAQLGVEWRP